MEYTDKIQ